VCGVSLRKSWKLLVGTQTFLEVTNTVLAENYCECILYIFGHYLPCNFNGKLLNVIMVHVIIQLISSVFHRPFGINTVSHTKSLFG
jgi:hypothetical protein